ncbi:Uncharacterized protein chloroplastic [Galdieria sulphuraria]|uniref:NAD(P)-binding domain-containing protein n=1 Tax=Galdieria sulphuraria TaxID=130081 RepID=M2XC53_GALSU|nr:uncharacterized protein Gasu_49370 [Galdieria sulphuraria]EME27487.1 hypothetical protein Gasu_49370 [Galdieria sulphuraria]GJD06459.1 Uncharacterized protein chloroplastic [Galdieria sulphuraria]|eukprot:XP_005704007.1 hypothetical protein Gasu_49370 [Galdieria sulphuraria]
MSDKGLVVVIGATGPLGKECVLALESQGYHVRAASRRVEVAREMLLKSVKNPSRVDFVHVDVLENSVLSSVLKDAHAVFFCASASAGWRVPGTSKNTPKQVDYLGAVHVAEAAAQAKVKRLVLVSSAMVTNRTSFPYLFLNSSFGRIMHWKRQGELGVIETHEKNPEMAYTIVRPGHLINEASKGAKSIMVDQGDRISWRVSRADVAQICCACLQVENTMNATFEVAGRKQATSQSNPPDTYEALLTTIKPDKKLSTTGQS